MKKVFLITIILCVALMSSCTAKESVSSEKPTSIPESSVNEQSEEITKEEEKMEAVYHKITPEEAKQMMTDTEGYILLDVRTQAEFDEAHIEGAIVIPDFEIPERAEAELPDKDQVILVYCRSGQRSAGAAKYLVSLGYTNIYDFGGIIDWPYETV